MRKEKAIVIRLDKKMYDALVRLAREKDFGISELVRSVLSKALDLENQFQGLGAQYRAPASRGQPLEPNR